MKDAKKILNPDDTIAPAIRLLTISQENP